MKRSSKIALGIIATLFSGLLVTGIITSSQSTSLPSKIIFAAIVVTGLREHFHADVELSTLHISIFPRMHVVGEGLVLRRKEDPDAPPLISVRKFILDGALREIFKPVPRFQTLTLEGLEMHIPAHRGDSQRSAFEHTN